MTLFLGTIFLLILLSLGLVLLVAEVRDRLFLFYGVLSAWAVLAPLTAYVHSWLPFVGGSDDYSYFDLASGSAGSIQSFADILDPSRFADVLEQPGYLVVLSLITLVTGPDLFAYKLFNLALLIVLAITWYRIATLLESAAFGRTVFVAILALTPLWFYVFFVLKDMTIVLLQSLFLFGLVQQWRSNSLSAWYLIVFATLALLPFRTFLVVQNVLVLLGSIGLKQFGREYGGRSLPLILAGIVAVVVLAIGSSSDIMASLGVLTEHRVIGSVEMRESVRTMQESTEMNRALFPLIYLFSETAGLSPATWESIDGDWLRGVLALPWIAFVVPFFVLGVLWIFKAPLGSSISKGLLEKLRNSGFVTTPWGGLLLFVMSMITISWIVGDTTRWRIPDMPVVATIAMAGWTFGSRRIREQVLILWMTGAGTLFLLYYLLRGA
ncbi:MAG: hypothetical protein NTV11_09685 [Rhodocyclales bacterium]|nr:hypothetical protein [Rhodocyclales bacterium]